MIAADPAFQQPAAAVSAAGGLLCIGLMSGTSMDGVDGVLAECRVAADGSPQLHQRALVSLPMPATLREQLWALNTPADNELHRAALAANGLMRLYADCSLQLCREAGIAPQQVAVQGAHGQTVRHRPGQFDGTGYSLQLVNGALLAELTGMAVACDFRSRDVAAGGQGAPLVPAFHQAIWGAGQPLAVLNLGGIANLSFLRPGQAPLGFDCGPANALLDWWCQRHTGQPYDAGGQWAARGQVLQPLLQRLLAEPYLQQPPPKSTGRDLFNPDWLMQQLQGHADAAAVDVQATLTAYTARAAIQAVQQQAADTQRLLVCGGGVRNQTILQHLRAGLPGVHVSSTADHGMDPQAVEAMAFAWLAWNCWLRQPLDLSAVTGAAGPRVLGCIYPA